MTRIVATYVLAWLLFLSGLSFAASPSFIQEAETTWMTTGNASVTTSSFTVQSGDILVAYAVTEDRTTLDLTNLPTNSGTAFTWTQRQINATNNYPALAIWTATASTGQSMTVSLTPNGTTAGKAWGLDVLTFRGSNGVGASSLTNVTGGAPTLNITTTQDNSVIVVINADWAGVDGASRTWRTNAGALTETTYDRDAARYVVYGGYHADAGSTGTYAVGLSAPGSQTYVIAAVEIKGTAGGGAAETFGFRKRVPQ